MEIETEQEQGRAFTAVYLPYSTFNTALDILKEGIPPKIDRTVFRGQSGGTQNQIMAAFSALGLIDADGRPIQPLLSRTVDDKTRKASLREILDSKYREVIDLHAANASDRSIMEALGNYNVSGTTLRKAAAFFIRAAEDVGVPLSPHTSKKVRATTLPAAQRKPRAKRGVTPPPTPPANTAPQGDVLNVDLGKAGTVSLTVNVKVIELTDAQSAWLNKTIKQMRMLPDEKAQV